MIIDQIQSQQVEIRWCGGEPFISEVYLNLMEYCVASGKNIQHIIQTNGSYLQKKADLFTKLLPTLKELRVSFDAATAATYAVTRTNGQWHTLLDNVRWARDTIRTQHAPTKLTADFVVQADNYQEIPAFVELCHSLEIDQINFQKMWNWGTWSQAEFDAKNIYNPQHSDYAKLVAVFEQAHVPIGY
jgi:molybdenum cofactor biosynthesis enzyme MoaA